MLNRVRDSSPDCWRFTLAYPERRSAQRFRIKLPMTVRWTSGSSIGEARTESRDVSSRGVYFFLPKDVQNGSPV